jgi:hypothetical protein
LCRQVPGDAKTVVVVPIVRIVIVPVRYAVVVIVVVVPRTTPQHASGRLTHCCQGTQSADTPFFKKNWRCAPEVKKGKKVKEKKSKISAGQRENR